GAFYLDVVKDRQYTCQRDSVARRSTQTAMYHILETLVRWAAPVLSFTAEEIWSFIPGERSASVFLEQWYPLDTIVKPDSSDSLPEHFWSVLFEVRAEVNKAMEEKRHAGLVKASLGAEVRLYCDEKILADLQQ